MSVAPGDTAVIRPTIGVDDLRRDLPELETRRLDNGLTVAVLPRPGLQVVASALAYRAGTRNDAPGHGGTAHFLEHMMFKGSRRYGPGQIDRITRALGGSNNAYTSHDMTLYYFTFAGDRWTTALAIEADRMAGLNLDPREVLSERQVIMEEIAMYEGEPWDALEHEVSAAAFPGHAYGRPVLGTRDELRATDADALRRFHAEHYRPSNAVLTLVGGVDTTCFKRAEEIFGDLPDRSAEGSPAEAPPSQRPRELVRRERRMGEVARLLLRLPAPAGDHEDLPALELLAAILAEGRASRLQRALVDEGQLCVGVSAHVAESLDPGSLLIAAEVLPGVEPTRVEETLFEEIHRLATTPPSEEETARAKRIVLADWLFDHERVHQQALLVATALTLFDAEHPWRLLERQLTLGSDELAEVAGRYLRTDDGAVLGWSLPARRDA